MPVGGRLTIHGHARRRHLLRVPDLGDRPQRLVDVEPRVELDADDLYQEHGPVNLVRLNELIDQVGTKGLAIPYKCSSCGASITIDKDSKKEGLKFCSYCGTAYNVEDMTKIIQHALE